MMSLESNKLTLIHGGFSAKKIEHGLYEVNGYLVDLFNKEYVVKNQIHIESKNNTPIYGPVIVKNSGYRGNNPKSSQDLFFDAFLFTAILPVSIIVGLSNNKTK